MSLIITVSSTAGKPKPQNNQTKNQTKTFPKKIYQRFQKQLSILPLLLNEMYQKLMRIEHVASVSLTPVQLPYPIWHKSNLTCEYHASVAGHNIHTCNALKKKLLQLINDGWITFEKTSNMSTNPLPCFE